jgi:hypothetical protein
MNCPNCGAAMRSQIIRISDGRFTQTFPMPDNDVTFTGGANGAYNTGCAHG